LSYIFRRDYFTSVSFQNQTKCRNKSKVGISACLSAQLICQSKANQQRAGKRRRQTIVWSCDCCSHCHRCKQ